MRAEAQIWAFSTHTFAFVAVSMFGSGLGYCVTAPVHVRGPLWGWV